MEAAVYSEYPARIAAWVAIEGVPPAEWKAKVYDPDIKKNMDKLYKKPGYSM